MIVITRDAEVTFLRELSFLNERSNERRCLYIRFSQVPDKPKDWFSKLTTALENISDGHIGQIYVCQDHDVLVIMPHLTDRHMQKFQSECESMWPHDTEKPFCSLYEIKIDYEFLRSLCEHKLRILKERNAKEEKQDQTKEDIRACTEILKSVDTPLISTLSSKRTERDNIHILVVEDDSLSRMMIKNVLMGDFTIYIATNASEALQSYLETAPDVVFLDIGLPDINGHELLAGLIQIDPEAYIIMFSGRRDQDNVLRALNEGALGFVGKPFSRGKLYQYIDQCPSVQHKKSRKIYSRNKAG
ncbi:MAG: response regulator [Alphaproteobacteria bacterium]|nr:response regulator [Alphaproteobacteria bacterium]